MTHSPEYRAEIRAMVNAGKNVAEIAEAMGRNRSTISQFCRKHGLEVAPMPYVNGHRTNPELEARKVAIADDCARGATLKEIGAKHDISRERVRQIAFKMGCMRKSRLIATYEPDNDT